MAEPWEANIGKVVKALMGPLTGLILYGKKGAVQGLTNAATAFFGGPLLAGASIVMAVLSKSPKSAAPGTGGPPQVFRQSLAESFIIYGRRRVGGLLAFYHAREVSDVHYRYFVIAAAGHHIQGNPEWMLGDEVVTIDGSNMVTSGPYASAAWLWL